MKKPSLSQKIVFPVPVVAENHFFWGKLTILVCYSGFSGQIIAHHLISNQKRPNLTIPEVNKENPCFKGIGGV